MASLLTYTVYMFTQHPEILARVRQEVLEAFGPDGTPTLGDIRKLKYRALFTGRNDRELTEP